MGRTNPQDWTRSRNSEDLRMARARRELLEFELRARKTLLALAVLIILSIYLAAALGEISLQAAIPLSAAALSGAAWLVRSGIGHDQT